jgi:DMSO/TMAO reductase YedYZ molybdopterin-dependent catalytic subunit
MSVVSRGFGRRRAVDPELAKRIPPGQHLVPDFPVLSIGPTPHVELRDWNFAITGEIDFERRLNWVELRALPSETVTTDIHCVTSWSKLGTQWEGVSLDTLLDGVQTDASHVMAFSDGDYETNLPLADITGGKAWLAYGYGGAPLAPEHGGPVRLLVPHLYFWKSAKWVRGLRLMRSDAPGFWERNGYHIRGDPWREERYWGD